MSIQLRDGLASQSVDLVLEDLLVRFLVNVPDEDLSSIERVFFQVEEAQWFYTDFVRQLDPTLPGMKMKQFSTRLLEKCPLIWKWGDPSDAISRFGKYKSTIPVRGVALFNKDLTKMILVKGTESNTWSFPRGKISKDESDLECALREVEEETGFYARDFINENDVVERTIKGKNYKIYLAKNVPEDYNFQPLARNEIASIEWHDIKQMQKKIRTNPQKYFIVATVMKPLTRWINKNKGVLNEEELMLKAEIKLKALLGINQPKQENVDAGRELLNLLQGVAPAMEPKPASAAADSGSSGFVGEQYVNMMLPQHLHNQLPFFNNSAINFPQAFPLNNQQYFFPPAAPVPPVPHSNQHGIGFPGHQGPQQLPGQGSVPSATPPHQAHVVQNQTSAQPPVPTHSSHRRSSEANSKELLSILNRRPSENKPHKAETEFSEAQATEINRSKADKLLNMFHNKTKQENKSLQNHLSQEPILSASEYKKSYLNRQHEPSNELEKSLQSSNEFSEPGKKLRILKRPENFQNSGNASADILSLLGKPPTSSEPSSKESSTEPKERRYSNELLDLLKRNKPIPSVRPIEEESVRLPENKSATNELLGLLNQGQKTGLSTGVIASNHIQNQNAAEDFQDFENFEDFEDFDNADTFESNQRQNSNELFDIASDDDETSHRPQKAYRETMPIQVPAAPKPPTQQKQASSSKSEQQKRPIRILKPGESLSDILGTKTSTPDEIKSSDTIDRHPNSNVDDGKSILSLLNGGKPPTVNEGGKVVDYSTIYGSPSDSPGKPAINGRPPPHFSAPQAPYPTDDIPNAPNSIPNQGSSLLDLLGRRPPSQQQPSPNQHVPNQAPRPLTLDDLESRQISGFPHTTGLQNTDLAHGSQSSAKDLLNILKGGFTTNDSASSFHSASSQL